MLRVSGVMAVPSAMQPIGECYVVRNRRLDLKHLRVVKAVSEMGSLRQAAIKLGVAQPPLGRQVRQAEEAVGAILFNRHSNGMTLTEAGREFLGHAIRLLDDLDHAADATAAIAAGASGTLRLEFTDDFLYGQLGRVLSRFSTNSPDVEITATMGYSSDIVSRLSTGATDVGFLNLPLPATAFGLRMCALEDIPLGVAVPADHRLAKRTEISLNALSEDTFLCGRIEPHTALYSQSAQLFAQARISPRLLPNIWPTDFLLDLVAAGRGVTLLALPAGRPVRADVCLIPLSDKGAVIKGAMIWSESAAKRGAVERFIRLMSDRISIGEIKKISHA